MFSEKYIERFQKVSEWQIVDWVKANTEILLVYFLFKKTERIPWSEDPD